MPRFLNLRSTASPECAHNPSTARHVVSFTQYDAPSSLRYPHNPRDYRNSRTWVFSGVYSARSGYETGISTYQSAGNPLPAVHACAEAAIRKSDSAIQAVAERSSCGVNASTDACPLCGSQLSQATSEAACTVQRRKPENKSFSASSLINDLPPAAPVGPAVAHVPHTASVLQAIGSKSDAQNVDLDVQIGQLPPQLELSRSELDNSALEKCTQLEGQITGLKESIHKHSADIQQIKASIERFAQPKQPDGESDRRKIKQVIAAVEHAKCEARSQVQQFQQHLVQLVESRETRAVMNASFAIKNKVRAIKRHMNDVEAKANNLDSIGNIIKAFM